MLKSIQHQMDTKEYYNGDDDNDDDDDTKSERLTEGMEVGKVKNKQTVFLSSLNLSKHTKNIINNISPPIFHFSGLAKVNNLCISLECLFVNFLRTFCELYLTDSDFGSPPNKSFPHLHSLFNIFL